MVGGGRPSESVDFNARDLLRQGKSVVGAVYGGADVRRDFGRIIRFWRRGDLLLDELVTNQVDLADVPTALAETNSGTHLRTIVRLSV